MAAALRERAANMAEEQRKVSALRDRLIDGSLKSRMKALEAQLLAD